MRAAPPPLSVLRPPRRRIGILSTYPPQLCGLATFTAALGSSLLAAGNRVDVIRIADGMPMRAANRPVVGELLNGEPESIRNVAALLARCDIAIIQHEFGIYGGADGDEILDLLDILDPPAIVVLHTVPRRPTTNQRSVLERVCDGADRVVVMADAARRRLVKSYRVDAAKVVMIPHGATIAIDQPAPDPLHPHLLTWGLLGPGKGIEHVIDALPTLGDLAARPTYTIAGVTHPKVFHAHGDAYVDGLRQRALDHGVGASVTFDRTYRDLGDLATFVAAASAVVLPYDSRDQATSGVLVDAIAAGRPVIATAFPHAVELLRSGAGIVVPHGDADALGAAIRTVVTDRDTAEAMAAEARRLAPRFSWAAVANQYVHLSDALMSAGEPVAM